MNFKELRILKLIRSGDMKAFEELFHYYYPGMCSYAESLVRKGEVAEEVVQDVFYNIWKNKTDLKITAGWQRYLYRSVFNNSMMYLRKSKKEFSLEEKWADMQVSNSPTPSEEMDALELDALILYTLQTLPERTQEIFRLNRFEGLKYQEIAEKMQISVKTVEANMGKALKAFRISLDEFRKTA